jgi:hypothetical protein
MNQVTINLSEKGISIARERAAERGFGGVEEYLSRIVEASLACGESDEAYGAPPYLQIKSKEHLEALIVEGLQSPGQPMTKEDWQQFRRELVERFVSGKGA